jgi:HEAT repeat protein
MRRCVVTHLLLVASALSAGAQVPVTGAPNASLNALAGTTTLVTVVLKGGAQDPNLRVVGVEDTYFNVVTEKGDRIPYLFETVEEVRVQGGAVEKTRVDVGSVRALRAEDQQIVADAWRRAEEVFNISNDDQERKIRAAMLLALSGNEDMEKYLRGLSEANDLKTAVSATFALYLAGYDVEERVVREGLRSGNRFIRGQAATLAGLTGYTESIPQLMKMATDRVADFAPPAILALARLDHQALVPNLLAMLSDLNEQRAMAAVVALTRLGDEGTVEELRYLLKNAEGLARFRTLLVMHALGAPEAKAALLETLRQVPTLTGEAALVLAKEGDWDATQVLRTRLNRREDATEPNLLFRARNAASLFIGGDSAAVAVFQDLLRAEQVAVKKKVFALMVEINDRRTLSIIQPSILSVNNEVALGACTVAAAMAKPNFRERLLAVREAGHDY